MFVFIVETEFLSSRLSVKQQQQQQQQHECGEEWRERERREREREIRTELGFRSVGVDI
jgi:hypothetical protein